MRAANVRKVSTNAVAPTIDFQPISFSGGCRGLGRSNVGLLHDCHKWKRFYSRGHRVPHPKAFRTVVRVLRVDLVDYSHNLVPYEEGWQLQKQLVDHVCQQTDSDNKAGVVVILQHLPVYTLGAGSTEKNLLFEPEHSPYPLYRTERGGEVTYHGPGQLVMYPVLNLRHFKQDLHWYLRQLEEVIIRALSEVSGLQGERVEGLTGVWVGGNKVAAIGVRASRWVTYHGLALNVSTDLSHFSKIVPCGIADKGVTSIMHLMQQEQQKSTSKFIPSSNINGTGQQVNPAASSSARGAQENERVLEQHLLREYQHGLLDSFEQVFGVELVADLEATREVALQTR